MGKQFPPVTINFAPVKVAGAAGVPLLVVVGSIAFVFSEARWLLLLGGLGGVLLAAAMIFVRRRRQHTGPSANSPTMIFPEISGPTREQPAGDISRPRGDRYCFEPWTASCATTR